jgi:hypothetical protein
MAKVTYETALRRARANERSRGYVPDYPTLSPERVAEIVSGQAARAVAPAPPRVAPGTVTLSEAQFAKLLTRVTEAFTARVAPVVESAPERLDLAAAARVDPVGTSTLTKLRAGTPLHELSRDEYQVVSRAFVRDRHRLDPQPPIRRN